MRFRVVVGLKCWYCAGFLALCGCSQAEEGPLPQVIPQTPVQDSRSNPSDIQRRPEKVISPSDASSLSISNPEAPPPLDELLEQLQESGLVAGAKVLTSRVDQEEPKHKLSELQAGRMAGYLLDDLPEMPRTKELIGVMPRTTVELVRSVHERDVAARDAEEIADYLLLVTSSMRFGNLEAVDRSHSHVVGREWHQIDYTGESMTWQGQKATWEPLGVINFKKAQYIRTYFKHVSKMRFFKRVYRPAGTLAIEG